MKHPGGDIPAGTLNSIRKQAGWKYEALDAVREAIDLHLEGLLDEGGEAPVPRRIAEQRTNPEFADGVWAVVDVDVAIRSAQSAPAHHAAGPDAGRW